MIEITARHGSDHQAGDTVVRRDSQRGRNAQSFAEGVFDGHKRRSLLRRYRVARTIVNLKRNPAVEINVVDIFQRRGYRFKGRALILPPDDDESLMIANWVGATNGLEYPVDHVVKIEATSITPLLSPVHVFAHPPRSQDEIRSTYYQKYGVKRIGA